ncbi:MAG: UbiA family prenyltransferase, partial [Candidatus Aenigmarchaeota archaeon]|nr:UbiA family prenyltransferase [Candidatus Aenigmarchaeota archaeon]
MVYTTSVLIGFPVSMQLLIILFLLTFSSYNLNKKTDIKEDKISHPSRAAFVEKHGNNIIRVSVLAYFVGALISFNINIIIGFLYLFFLFSCIIYSKNITLGTIKISRLKNKFVIKNITVAFTWALVTTLIPVFFFNNTQIFNIILIFLFIFFKVFANTIFFDIRDIKGDMAVGIKTIPVHLGIEKTKIFLQK